jgi:hypothetical protein
MHKIEKLVFDREPGIMTIEKTLKDHGIELSLKAAGQKAALAEMNITIIRFQARKTKVGI